jgi:hypothetical protein
MQAVGRISSREVIPDIGQVIVAATASCLRASTTTGFLASVA